MDTSADEISQTYSKVASYKGEIYSNRKKELSNLHNLDHESIKTEEELKAKIAKVKNHNLLIRKKLNSIDIDNLEQKKLKVSLKGNNSIINSLEAQRAIWNKFHWTQQKMLESLNINGEKVDFFLHVLDVNAEVYSEAANVARLRCSAKIALESLGALTDIQDIIGDVESSWSEVNNIVFEISQAEFTLDIE